MEIIYKIHIYNYNKNSFNTLYNPDFKDDLYEGSKKE